MEVYKTIVYGSWDNSYINDQLSDIHTILKINKTRQPIFGGDALFVHIPRFVCNCYEMFFILLLVIGKSVHLFLVNIKLRCNFNYSTIFYGLSSVYSVRSEK